MNHAIANLFSGPMVNAISHTLVHSLWQGALLSVITGLIMACTRKSSSALRYTLLVSNMVLFTAAVSGTFIFELGKGGAGVFASAGHYAVGPGPVTAGTIVAAPAPSSSLVETIGSYLNEYAATIVSIWFLIVCAQCVRLASSLHAVYSLRHKGLFTINSFWEERVRQLSLQMGITRQTAIAESGRTKTPIVTGHLKPLILIPLGMFTSLSPEEAEAVLLHELAHIRRADYLVNLFQNLLEIVFFFNPAVLWLSALIKAERENCCDDIVVGRSGKVNYIKALVACQEFLQPSPVYAMALKGSNGGLKNRVARIISNKNQSLNGREKSLLAACLIATGIFAAAFVGRVQHENMSPVSSAYRFKNDTDKTNSIIRDMLKDSIISSTNGLSFKIGTTEFVVNYQKQPDAVYQKYRAKYVDTQYHGTDDWIWYYEFDSQKWESIKARSAVDHPETLNVTTGVFKGKEN